MPSPRVAVGPKPAPLAVDAVAAGGGTVVEVGADTEALVWLDPRDVDALRQALERAPGTRWVQLPWAGVEPMAATGIFGDGRTWTCAKGVYAEPVAEHALTLALAGLRHLRERTTATSWGVAKGTSLYDADVTILGGGGIAHALLEQLAPFRVRATAVRRNAASPVAGAARTVDIGGLHDAVAGALVVFVALALTPSTRGIIDAAALAAMDERAWLVNVGRGGHVVTGDLIAALEAGTIAGAALDVTDPEPLPDGHPLWSMPNVIITPHTADWPEIIDRKLAGRIRTNVAHFARGEELEGLVDPGAGY